MKIRFLRLILVVCILLTTGIFSIGCTTPPLTTESIPESGGIVTPPKGEYKQGVQVNVIASPNSGYRFDHWEGSASGTAPNFSITMDGSKHLKAYFKKIWRLSTSVSPSSGGKVTGAERVTYDEGSAVTLNASPEPYYQFTTWAGDISGNAPQITVTMNSDKNVVANFTPKILNLTTHVNTTGSGSVEPSGGTYQALSQVKITAVVANGYRWDKWTGSEISTSNPLTIIMNTDKDVTANFIKLYSLQVSADPVKGTASPTGGTYDAGTKVELTATSVFPYAFTNWVGTDNDNANPTKVTMNAEKPSVSVSFKELHAVTKEPISITKEMIGIPFTIETFKDMHTGEWIKGQIAGVKYDIAADIRDSNSNVVMEFGRLSVRNFTFQAPRDGDYSFYVYKIYGLGNTDCVLSYTLYR